jgi:predicted ester cyclase
MEIHPNVLSANAVIGNSIVNRAGSNKGHCRRFIEKIFNEGELSQIWDFMSPDVVNHELADSLGDDEPEGRNIEWMVDLIHLYRYAFPDLHLEIQDQIAEGDRVVTCLRMQGTHKNALMTIAASGRKIDLAGIRVDRMVDGKIVESWFHLDALGMLRQLNAMPVLNRRPQVAPVSHDTAPGSGLPFAGWTPFVPSLPQSASVN